MAYQYWQLMGKPKKQKFLSLRNAYHGDTVGSVSVGGMDTFHARFKGCCSKHFTRRARIATDANISM